MGPEQLVFMIPIVAIVMGIGVVIVKLILNSNERVQALKAETARSTVGLNNDQLTQIRAEMAMLRDTTTQHAISLQHAMERLEHRVDFLEQKTSVVDPSATSSRPRVIGRI